MLKLLLISKNTSDILAAKPWNLYGDY